VVDQRLTNTAGVRHARCLADPDPVVHHGAEMLDEVSVQISRHAADPLRRDNLDAGVGGARRPRREQPARGGCGHAHEITPG
jgi:hypothetical protein